MTQVTNNGNGSLRSCNAFLASVMLPLMFTWYAAAYLHNPIPHPISLHDGRQLFEKRCASCHSTTVDGGSKIGPSLATIGRDAATRKPGLTNLEYIVESILDPNAFRANSANGQMPVEVSKNLTIVDLRNLVAFVASHGAEVDQAELLRLDMPMITSKGDELEAFELTQVMRGKELFFGKAGCVNCHSMDAKPGAEWIAPSLQSAGIHSVAYLRDSILNPNSSIVPGYETTVVVTTDGVVQQGREIGSDGNRSFLAFPKGEGDVEVAEILHVDVESRRKVTGVSSMPSGRTLLDDGEVEALVSFLRALRGFE